MKNIPLFLIIIGILTIPARALALTVSVSEASGLPADQNIPVVISLTDRGTEEIYGIDLRLKYEPDLIQATAVAAGSLTAEWNIDSYAPAAGEVTIALYGISALPEGAGSIAEIIFDVDAAAPSGKVALSLTKAEFSELAADKINSGSFTIKAVPADEDEDKQSETIETEAELPEEEIVEQESEETEKTQEIEEQIEQETEEYMPSAAVPRIIVYHQPEEEALDSVTAAEPSASPEEAETVMAAGSVQPEAAQEQSKQRYPRAKQQDFKRPEVIIGKKTEVQFPQIEIGVKQVKRIFFWRVYRLELKQDLRPFFWQLSGEQRLPFLLRLNKRAGTIYGIVWGKRNITLDFVVITQDRERITGRCKLEIQ